MCPAAKHIITDIRQLDCHVDGMSNGSLLESSAKTMLIQAGLFHICQDNCTSASSCTHPENPMMASPYPEILLLVSIQCVSAA